MKYILLLLTLIFFNCSDKIELENKKMGSLLASVDTSSLYDSTLIFQYPFLNKTNNFMKINYVNKWINRKLLLKKIYDDKFNLNPKIKQKLKKLEEDFLLNLYTDKLLKDNKISKDKLEEYYKNHISDFSISNNEYKYQLIYFNKKEAAKKIYHYMKAKKKFNFNYLPNELNTLIIQKEIIGKFTPKNEINSKKIKSILSNLKIGSFSKPMESDGNYIIVKLLDKRVKGDSYPFIEVEGEIMLKEYSKYESQKINDIVDSMKLYNDVNIYINGDKNE